MACKNCPIPDDACIENSEQELFAHTECVTCGYHFLCEGDMVWTVATAVNNKIYPVCHPQDCRAPETEEQEKAWDVKYRATIKMHQDPWDNNVLSEAQYYKILAQRTKTSHDKLWDSVSRINDDHKHGICGIKRGHQVKGIPSTVIENK